MLCIKDGSTIMLHNTSHIHTNPNSLHVHTNYTYQYVAVLSRDIGSVYAQMPCHGRAAPAGRKSTPRPVQAFEVKVTEIRLQQLLQVVAKLHVKVSMENGVGGAAVVDRECLRRNAPVKESKILKF
jgi:hypothetical protein